MIHSRTDRESTRPTDPERILDVDHSIPHKQVVEQIVDKAGDTQSDGEDHQRFSQLVGDAQDAKVVSRHDPAVNW